MPERHLITLTDSESTTAVVAPELGGWLLRYARKTPKHGAVEALHNNRMQQTAPLGGRASNGSMDAAASCAPFGAHRRRC